VALFNLVFCFFLVGDATDLALNFVSSPGCLLLEIRTTEIIWVDFLAILCSACSLESRNMGKSAIFYMHHIFTISIPFLYHDFGVVLSLH
jgi:hypothetical protein